MGSLFTTVFPRLRSGAYSWLALSVGVIVALVLVIFQPFGTANFEHPHKVLLLIGYGVVVAISVTLYYTISRKTWLANADHSWTVVKEVREMFLSILISLFACFLYATWLYDWTFSVWNMGVFALNAISVAAIPCSLYLVVLYFLWKDVQRSTLELTGAEGAETRLQLIGENRNDTVEVKVSSIRYIKAHDNYIMLYLLHEGASQRHILRSTMRAIEDQLPSNVFRRVHRSFIVNIQHVITLEGNKSRAFLCLNSDNKRIPVGRAHYDEFRSQFGN